MGIPLNEAKEYIVAEYKKLNADLIEANLTPITLNDFRILVALDD